MPSVNVYVSAELRDRMARHELNWSQIASAGFVRAIDLEELKLINEMETGLARLRQSRGDSAIGRRAEGFKAGKIWALNAAEYDELKRVAALRATDYANDMYGYQPHVVQAIYGDVNLSAISGTIEKVFGDGPVTEESWEGFVEGAGEVFDAI